VAVLEESIASGSSKVKRFSALAMSPSSPISCCKISLFKRATRSDVSMGITTFTTQLKFIRILSAAAFSNGRDAIRDAMKLF